MRRRLILYIILTGLPGISTFTQRISITSHAGYAFDDHISSAYQEFSGEVKGGLQWGMGVEYSNNPSFGLELLYLRQNTGSRIKLPAGQETMYDLAINYILLTGTNYLDLRRGLFAHPGSVVGLAIMKVKDPASDHNETAVKFTFGIKAGLSYSAGKKISLRMQGTLLATIQAVGGRLYFGSSGIGYTSLLQFNMGGGIVFHLSKYKAASK